MQIAQSLVMLVVCYSTAGLREFTKFVMAEHSEENIMFWAVCKQYSENPTQEAAKSICSQYIDKDSEFEVWLPLFVFNRRWLDLLVCLCVLQR